MVCRLLRLSIITHLHTILVRYIHSVTVTMSTTTPYVALQSGDVINVHPTHSNVSCLIVKLGQQQCQIVA